MIVNAAMASKSLDGVCQQCDLKVITYSSKCAHYNLEVFAHCSRVCVGDGNEVSIRETTERDYRVLNVTSFIHQGIDLIFGGNITIN